MRHAFTLLGIMTLVVSVGTFIAFRNTADAPSTLSNNKNSSMSLTLTSPVFTEGGVIPAKYTCDDANISPELHIGNIPEGTKSFVLVMDDPDIPESIKKERGIEKIDHWVLYNIPATTNVISEGALLGKSGVNSRGVEGYMGPCPPDREHRYFFRLYALPQEINFLKPPMLHEVEAEAQKLMIGSATLMGRYEREAKTQ